MLKLHKSISGSKKMSQTLIVLLLFGSWAFSFFKVTAQCPTTNVTIPANGCVNSPLNISNSTAQSLSYDWNFCAGGLKKTPTANHLGTFSGAFVANLHHDINVHQESATTQWYGFACANGTSSTARLIRLSFGNDLQSTPTVVNLGNFGLKLVNPRSTAIIEEAGNFYVFVVNGKGTGAADLVRINFGSSLANTPSNSDVTVYTDAAFAAPKDVVFVKENGTYVAYVACTGQIVRAVFSAGIQNAPTIVNMGNLTGGGSPIYNSTALARECGQWFAFVSLNGNQIHRVPLGSSLINPTPSASTNLTFSPNNMRGPAKLQLVRDSLNWYLFYANFTTGTNSGRISQNLLGSTLNGSNTLTEVQGSDYANPSGSTLQRFGLKVVRVNSRWVAFSMNRTTGELMRLDYPALCNLSDFFGATPTDAKYSSQGTYQVEVKMTATDGSTVFQNQLVTINPAASADFTATTACLGTATQFNSVSSGPKKWNFGDNSPEFSGENPTHIYSASGTYTVRLTVTTALCDAIVEKQVTVSNKPSAQFNFTNGCQGVPIPFADASTVANGTITAWDWNFNPGTSTAQNPNHTFASAGNFNVRLIVTTNSGCKDTLTQTITINANPAAPGPVANFTKTDVCAGNTVTFTNTSVGLAGVSSINWTFAGGNPATSTAVSPTVTYDTPGTYDVQLDIQTATGCSSSKVDVVNIYPNPTAAYTITGALCSGNSLTFNNTSSVATPSTISSYNWDIQGIGTFTTQNLTNIPFTTPGSYPLTLTVTTNNNCSATVKDSLKIIGLNAVWPDSICLSQELSVTNTSPSNYQFVWDFCSGDIGATASFAPTNTTNLGNFNTLLSESRNVSLFRYNNKWYAYSVDFLNNKLILLDYGTDLLSATNGITATDLGNPFNALNGPTFIKYVEDGGQHYALVANDGGDNLVRFNFGGNPTAAPASSAAFGGLTTPNYLDFAVVNGSRIVLVTDRDAPNVAGGGVFKYDFGSSLANASQPAVALTIPASPANIINEPTGIQLLRDCGGWYAFVSNVSNNSTNDNISRLNFGETIPNTVPSANLIALATDGLSNPVGIQVINDNGAWWIFTLSGNKRIQIGLASTLGSPKTSFTDWGGTISSAAALESALYNSARVFFTPVFTGSQRGLIRWRFESANCSASIPQSYNFIPSGVSYLATGNNTISLYAIASDGSFLSQTKSIYVKDGPIANFSALDGCQGEPILFQNLSNGVSYIWNFNGEGSSSQVNPSFSFTTPGVKNVSLTVAPIAGSSCSPTFTKQIYVGHKPTANFTNDVNCANTLVTFTDLSSANGDSIVTWEWTLLSGLTFFEKSPKFTYDNPGSYPVQLIVTTQYGCKDTIVKTIDILEKPKANFNIVNTCFGETATFTNSTNGTGVSYIWNFGDPASGSNNSSFLPTPSHQFTALGDYTVRLIAVSTSGCVDTLIKTFRIGNPIQPNYTTNISACQSAPVSFTNTSIVPPGETVDRWIWVFGDGDSLFTQNASHTYLTPGNYTAKLIAVGKTDCRTEFSSVINVKEAPVPSFTNIQACVGQTATFNNTTSYPAGQTRASVSWTIDGSTINTTNATYTFSSGGVYPVTLTETSSNGCITSTTQQITVPAKPVADFTFLSSPCSGTAVPFTDNSIASGGLICDWRWTFPEGTTSAQNPNVTFESPGVYPVSLFVISCEGCTSDVVTKNVQIFVTDFFVTPDTVCLNQPISFVNESIGAVSQNWDFCAGDFDNPISGTVLANYNTPMSATFDFTVVKENNNWYGFSCNTTTDKIYRYDFGNASSNTPGAAIELAVPTPSTTINGARSIKIAQQGSEKYGFVCGTNLRGLTRFKFGTSVANANVTDLVQFDASTANIPGVEVEVVRDAGLWYVFLLAGSSTTGKIYRYHFGNNLAGNPTQIDEITVPNNATSIELAKDCKGWYAFVTVSTTSTAEPPLTKWFFGSSLANTPLQMPMSFSGGTPFQRLGHGELVNEAGIWYFFAHNEFTPAFIRLRVGPVLHDPLNTVLPAKNFADLSLAAQGRRHALCAVKDGSNWRFFTTSRDSRNLMRYDFQNICSANPSTSTLASPNPTLFTTSGKKMIALENLDGNGQPTYVAKPVFVLRLPQLNFSTQNLCAGQTVTFQNNSQLADTSGGITLNSFTWKWLLGEPGVTSDSIHATHTFSQTGTYTISLIVSSSIGCSDTLTRNITIYNSPNADFSFSTGVCAKDPITFTDLSTITGDNIGFRKWIMGNGETRNEPGAIFSHYYPIGGDYTVTLIVQSLNGCTDTVSKVVRVPKINFTYSSTCEGDTVKFTPDLIYPGNPTINTVWNLGGDITTVNSPSKVFPGKGSYPIQLIINTGTGCKDTIEKMLVVGERPNVDFKTNGGLCKGKEVEFLDLSQSPNLAEPLGGWSWNFGDPGSGNANTSILRNPTHVFSDTGTYVITLAVRTQTNCIVTLSKTIRITDAPTANFGLKGVQCQGVSFWPTDSSASPNGGSLSYLWLYKAKGVTYYSTLPRPIFSFADTGSYQLTLVVSSASGCSDTLTKDFVIVPAPKAAFTFTQDQALRPAKVTVRNQSTGASSFQWFFGDSAQTTSTLAVDSIIYTKPGEYQIQLVVTNDSLCFDTLSQTIVVLAPVDTLIDIAVTDIVAEYDGVFVKIRASVFNKGNVTVPHITMFARLSHEMFVKEDWNNVYLTPNETRIYEFAGRFYSNPNDSLGYVCVEAYPVALQDVFLPDNIRCESLNNQFEIINFYPNPTEGEVNFKYVAPSPDALVFDVIDMAGRLIVKGEQVQSRVGLNEFKYDFTHYAKGWYTLRFYFLEQETILRFMKK